MAVLNAEELLEIKRWVRVNNYQNHELDFKLNIGNGKLYSIEVRFIDPTWSVLDEKIKEIYRCIRVISHYSLIPEESGDIRYGILKMNISYATKWEKKHIIRGLNFVRDDIRLV